MQRNRIPTIAAVMMVLFMGVTCPTNTQAQVGFLGLQVQGLDPLAAKALGLGSPSGVLVKDVAVGEPGAIAGIRRGDLIIKFNSKIVRTFADLILAVRTTKPRQNVPIEVRRDGIRFNFVLSTTKRPAPWNVKEKASHHYPDLGFAVTTLTNKVRKNFSIRWGATGLVVTTVEAEGIVSRGFREGEVIHQANLRDLWHPRQLTEHIEAARTSGRENLLLLVEGPAGYRYILMPLKK